MDHPEAVTDIKELRKFGLLIGFLVAGIWGILLPRRHGDVYSAWPWIVSIAMVAWSLLMPRTLAPVHRAWTAIGRRLGMINSRLVLGLLFYVVFTPIGLALRLFGKDTMGKRFTNDRSYRVASEAPTADRMERPY